MLRGKSPLLILGLTMSIIFITIYAALFAFLTEPLYLHLSIAGQPMLSSTLHAILIACLGTAVCCLFYLQRDKRLVPTAYGFLALLLAASYGLCFVHFSGEERAALLSILNGFALPSLLIGGAAAFVLYCRLKHRQHVGTGRESVFF